MGSDFRPHGCDPMGSAVGITPNLHAKPAIARALKVHIIQLSYIHTPAQTTTNRKHCPNPKPHLPFNQLIVSLISTDAVQVAP